MKRVFHDHCPGCNPIGILILGLILVHASRICAAEPGITRDSIILGQSCAVSGPAMDLGTGMKSGLHAAFDEMNAKGGVHGRKIYLNSRDDYYEPGQAARNTETFIFQDKVFLLIGYVGTPTSQAVLPIAKENGVPFFAPLTGAGFLRVPFLHGVINLRAGYDEEMMHMISYLVKTRGLIKIACFYQDDSFGRTGLDGVRRALAIHGLDLEASGCFQRNTVAVLAGLLAIQKSRPQAVVLVGPHHPCAEFIKLAVARGLDNAVFCTLSFAGIQALNTVLGPIPQEVIVSQVMPWPWGATPSLVRDFRDAMTTFRPRTAMNYSSLEGYLAGRLFCHIANRVTGDLTRQGFITALEQERQFDLVGIPMEFGPLDHQGMDRTFLLKMQNGGITPLDTPPETP